jgi:hypothetical protein
MLEEKNIQSKKYLLGQFFTPSDLVSDILDNISVDSDVIVEPSFGGCGFFDPILKKYTNAKLVGIELDPEWFAKGAERYPDLELYSANFYDIDQELKFDTKRVSFVGNVPFRSPAYSLTTHKKYVKYLAKKYGVTGIREEAVFFIMKTADIMISNRYEGGIHYIIPKSLITNDSKFYMQFKRFLKKYFKIVTVFDINPNRFENVAQGLIMLSMTKGGDETDYTVKHNGVDEPVNGVLQLVSTDIPFQNIFKKTYLGSVPAESFLLSASGESKESFRDRMVEVFSKPATIESLRKDLAYDGTYSLKILSSKDQGKVDAKLSQIKIYTDSIRKKVDLSIFGDENNYFPIQHRKEIRYYFRNKLLKNCDFVYELNPNPQPSFFFTSNPSAGSTDYFGYCSYDITRNSSPGCCRTIPLADIEDNVLDEFKSYWSEKAPNIPLVLVFNYIQYISNTAWYKQQKKLRKRFYFCLPRDFKKEWIDSLDIDKELERLSNFYHKMP